MDTSEMLSLSKPRRVQQWEKHYGKLQSIQERSAKERVSRVPDNYGRCGHYHNGHGKSDFFGALIDESADIMIGIVLIGL